ncbi:hypothetical protein [Halostreptopolyspora alba]|uniref:hypothetical protein n=1 Tax=Halostreptopolyspora alba TaxID=2487137 RepID=UPI0026A87BB1
MASGGSRGSRGGHLGRWRSWLWVAIMIAGFTTAGVGLTLGPSWNLVIGGTAAFVLSGIAALATGIMADVTLDAPRDAAEEPHGPLSRRRRRAAPGSGDDPAG